MFFVALITFSLAHLAPGNPFDKNPNRPMPQETIDRISRFYGVDQPIPVQFITYMGNILRGDLGISFTRRTPVVDVIGQGIGTTFQLGIGALVFALAFSIPLGIISALKQNTMIDYLSMLVATIGTTIPGFVLAIFLIYIFGVNLHLLPFVGCEAGNTWSCPCSYLDSARVASSPGLPGRACSRPSARTMSGPLGVKGCTSAP